MPYARRKPETYEEQQARIVARPDGGVRLAVIADTHSQPHPRALELVAQLAPDAILHAGDIGDEVQALTPFAQLAPLHAIRGNIDARGAGRPDLLNIEVGAQAPEPFFASLKILLLHIAVAGPKLRADAARLAQQRGAQLIVCGHSHVPFIGRDRGFTIFNPGSIGPRRFHLPIVFGVIELKANQLSMWHVDCETGGRWLPP